MTVNPVAVIRYQYDNHLGSASLELDEQANIISYEEYHPFGTTSYRSGRTETETSQKRYKYVGKERDEETGLYYYGFRYYAAWLCRFVSVDPLQFEYPNYTPFQYAGNKPISYIDLDGLEEAQPDEPNKSSAVPISPVINPNLGPIENQYILPVIALERIIGNSADASVIEPDEKYELNYKAYHNLKGWDKIQGPTLSRYIEYAIDSYLNDFNSFTPYRKLITQFEENEISFEEFALGAEALLNLRQKKDDDDNTDGINSVYITIRNYKKESWFYKVDQELVYVGLTKNEEDRYSKSTIQYRYMEFVAQDISKDEARGIEQILIELNNSNMPFPSTSTTVDNKINSTSPFRLEYYKRKILGYLWLEKYSPNWRTNYKRSPENIKNRLSN